MMAFIGLGLLLVVVFALLTALARAHELCCVSVRRGRSLVVRGSLAASTQQDLERVFHGSPDEVLVRVFEREGDTHVEVTGASDTETRRLQALLGVLHGEDLPPILPHQRTWSRRLGFVWLAWWLEDRDRDDPPQGPPPPRSNVTPFRR